MTTQMELETEDSEVPMEQNNVSQAEMLRMMAYEQDPHCQWVYEFVSYINLKAAQGYLHCDWYTPRGYTVTKNDITFIEDRMLNGMTVGDINVRYEILEPNIHYAGRRVRIHASWEE